MLNSFQHLLGAPAPLKGKFIMDRNLGARDTKFAEDDYKGVMYYQCGRKEAFPGSSYSGTASFYTNSYIGRTDTNWTITNFDTYPTSGVPISIGMSNPMIFYNNSANLNWASSIDSETYIWNDYEQDVSNNGKSLFDPSPLGWKVPSHGTWSSFTTETMTDWVYAAESDQIGRSYPLADDRIAYYPPYGFRNGVSGEIGGLLSQCRAWSSTPASTTATYRLYLTATLVADYWGSTRALANPVRPVQHDE